MEKRAPKRFVDITGQTFNFLTVIKMVEPTYNTQNNRILNWLCKCVCGNEKVYFGGNIKSGATKSCGCKKKEITRKLMKEYSERVYPFSVEKNLFSHYKVGALKRKYDFEIDFEYFKDKIKENCFYCKREPYNIHKSKPKSQRFILYNGLDRVDNKKGYLKENIVTCCKECNYLKGTYSHDDFIRIIKLIAPNF